jgi:hypothetical protein
LGSLSRHDSGLPNLNEQDGGQENCNASIFVFENHTIAPQNFDKRPLINAILTGLTPRESP